MAKRKLLPGEQYLVQTVDKRIALTTHRLIQRRLPWQAGRHSAIMLEDIAQWDLKSSGNSLYLALSLASALLVYFNDSFLLLSGFFVALYLMTRRHKIHIRTVSGGTMVLPLDVEQKRMHSLINMVKHAQKNRLSQLHRPVMAAA